MRRAGGGDETCWVAMRRAGVAVRRARGGDETCWGGGETCKGWR